MKRVVQPLLVVLLLGAVGFGVVQFNEGGKLKTELAGLGRERDDLQRRVSELEKMNAELAAKPDRRGGPLPGGAIGGSTPERAVMAQPVDRTASDMSRSRLDGGRFNAVMNSPEVQQLMAIQQKAGLDGRYAALFKRLNLGPAELEQFKNLLVEKQSAVMDVFAAARSQGLGGRDDRDEIRQLVQDTQAEIDESIRTAIGDAAYAQYKGYETTLPQRGVVDQLGQRLSYSAAPLSETQADQLVQILSSTAPTGDGRNRIQAAMPVVAAFSGASVSMAATGGGVRITDEAVALAQGVLSGQQFAALQSLQREQQAAAQLMEQMRVNRQNRQGGAQLPTDPGGG